MNNNMKKMHEYILTQNIALNENLLNRKNLTKSLMCEYLNGEYSNVVIVASGSSYNASMAVRNFMMNTMGIYVKVITPNTFVYYESKLNDDDFVFVISQSGCSTNAIQALRKLKIMGRKAIGVTGNPESDFKEESDLMVDYGVNGETIGYVTKGVTTLFAFLAYFALEAAYSKKNINDARYDEIISELNNAIEMNKEIAAKMEDFWHKHIKNFTSMKHAFIMGTGPNYGTALEAALKMSETIQIPCLPIETEEFIHGFTLQVNPTYNLFFIDPSDSTSKRVIDLYNSTKKITDRSYIISNNLEIDDDRVISYSKSIVADLTPLAFLPVFQSIAYLTTDSLNIWEKHPLYYIFKDDVPAKTEKYVDTVA